MAARETDPRSQLYLPPGFRFSPTDEELLVQYLCRKVSGHQFSLQIIGEIDLYKFNPWELPDKALFGEKEWYFFSPRDRKYPNGTRPNRVAGSGYWKATGTDKSIAVEGRKVGTKKALVFYVGKAPGGSKTGWIMHEYRLSDPPRSNGGATLDAWVLCRIYEKNAAGHGTKSLPSSSSSSSAQYDDVLGSLPGIDDFLLDLPGMEEDQKPLFSSHSLGQGLETNNGIFDCTSSSVAGLGPVDGGVVGWRNGVVASTAVVDEETQSRPGNRRINGLARKFNGARQSFGGSFVQAFWAQDSTIGYDSEQ